MILFLKLILWPALCTFLLGISVCVHVFFTKKLTDKQVEQVAGRFLLWLLLSFITSAGLVAIYFN